MFVTSQDNLSGFEIDKTLGLVTGNTVRSRNIFRNMLASFQMMVGGEINEFTNVLNEAREEAYSRMEENAKSLGADAIVCIRYQTAEIGEVCSEILVYGTAVKLKK